MIKLGSLLAGTFGNNYSGSLRPGRAILNSAQHFDEKAKSNKATHRVDFQEALRVFADPLARICEDEEHSGEEPREIIIGHSVRPRLIFVRFTVRDRRIRIISARQATPAERKDYEENVGS